MAVRTKYIYYFLTVVLAIVFSSCGRYTQNIMFAIDEDTNYDSLGVFVDEVNSNYRIDIDDYLEVDVFTSNGERLIDPDRELVKGIGNNNSNSNNKIKYLVDINGQATLPMIGKVDLSGLTLFEADSVLAEKYNVFYTNTFVKTKCLNRRVTVLGAMGGTVVNLENENTNLLEVLALVGGLDNTSKATNIRIIRGELSNPAVQVIDLRTIEGMKKASLRIQNKDVIYVEPFRKPMLESIKDVTPILSFVTTIITFVFVITNLK